MDATSLNIKAIKRIDPKATGILNSASRAAVYDYDKNAASYKNCQVTGSLFIYKRNEAPYQSVMLMNVKNNSNIILKITKNLEVRQNVEHQVIHWKDEEEVKCIWFHDIEELRKIGDQVIQISEMLKLQEVVGSQCRRQIEQINKTNNNSVDIMKMLSEAAKREQVANTTTSTMTSPPFNPLSGAISVVDLENPLRSNKSGGPSTINVHNAAFNKLLPKLKQEPNEQESCVAKPLSLLTRSGPPSGGSCSSSPDSIIDQPPTSHPHSIHKLVNIGQVNLANDLKKLLIKPTNSAFTQITPTPIILPTLTPAATDIRSRMSIPPPTYIVGANMKLQTSPTADIQQVLMSPEDFMPKPSVQQLHNNNEEWLSSYMSQTTQDPLFPQDQIKFAEVMINLLKFDSEFRSRLHESYMQEYRRQNNSSVVHHHNGNNRQYRDDSKQQHTAPTFHLD